MKRLAIAPCIVALAISLFSHAAVARASLALEYAGYCSYSSPTTMHLDPFTPTQAWIRVYPDAAGFLGAEFRITGLPGPNLLSVQTAPGQGIASAVGDPFGLGCRVALIPCQTPAPRHG